MQGVGDVQCTDESWNCFPSGTDSTRGSSQCTPVPPTNTLLERKLQPLLLDPFSPFLSSHSSSQTGIAFPETAQSQLFIGEYCIDDMELEKSLISWLASPHFGLMFLFICISGDLEPFVLCYSIYFPGFSKAAESIPVYITAIHIQLLNIFWTLAIAVLLKEQVLIPIVCKRAGRRLQVDK